MAVFPECVFVLATDGGEGFRRKKGVSVVIGNERSRFKGFISNGKTFKTFLKL